MKRISRRAFLGLSAAALAARSAVARATCEPIALAPGERLPLIAFLDEASNPQGARLEEFRGRLAAQDLGDDRARFEPIVVDTADAARMRCVMEALAAEAPLALVTVSETAARHAAAALPSVPLVFALDVDPVATGLVDSLGARRTNATGFTFDLPVSPDRKAIEVLLEAFPGTRRAIVVADDAWHRHAGRDADLREVRRRFGVEIAAPRTASPWLAVTELQRAKPGASDACYVPRCEALFQAVAPVAGALHRARVPHLFGDERALRHGAMLAFGPRRLAHWEAMASMLRLIASGVPAREIPVQRPAEFVLSVSLAQWQRMGLKPSRALLRRAHTVL